MVTFLILFKQVVSLIHNSSSEFGTLMVMKFEFLKGLMNLKGENFHQTIVSFVYQPSRSVILLTQTGTPATFMISSRRSVGSPRKKLP